MRGGLSIRSRLLLWIAAPTLAIYVGVLGLLMVDLRRQNRQEVMASMERAATDWAARFDGAFREVAAIGLATARFAEIHRGLDRAGIEALLRGNVSQSPTVYGSALAFEPGLMAPADELFCPYVFRDGDALRAMNIGRDVYDWYADPAWTWYRDAKEAGAPVWSTPYFDEGAGGALMVTFSAPLERDGAHAGVATVDVLVETIRERIAAGIEGPIAFVVLSPDGRFVLSRRGEELGPTVFEATRSAGREDIAAVAERMVAGGTGVAVLPGFAGAPPEGWEDWGETRWVAYAPIPSTGWSLAAVAYERDALASANARLREAAVGLALALALIVGAIWLVSGRLAGPVVRLTGGVRRIAGGDLDHRVAVETGGELGTLASSVNTMAADLKDHMERLAAHRASSREAMILAMAKLAESRDDDTGKHLVRICLYVEVLAVDLSREDPELTEEWVRTVTATAALHDIGKVGIPDSVLKKPGRLTDDERRVMNAHTTIGGDTLIAVKQNWSEDAFLRTAAEIALAHHERWDGSGYPYGLSGETIALAARITAVADVYDALTSKRVYKEAMPHEKARAIIEEGRGAHFDPRVVDAFVRCEARFREIADEHR
jgi:HD-GYP domain-containing protein (c-di-GMP phosphodiesterase class II)